MGVCLEIVVDAIECFLSDATRNTVVSLVLELGWHGLLDMII